MPKPKSLVPNAWDDNWEAAADREAATEPEPEPEPQPITKKQLLAKHEEENKKIWNAAEAPSEPFHFLSIQEAAVPSVPASTSAEYFKPAVKVLSRNPNPSRISQRLLPDDEGEEAKPTPEELRRRQEKEREEKQKRYNEARARIFGDKTTKPSSPAGQRNVGDMSQQNKEHTRGRGRGRGGRGGRGGGGGGTGGFFDGQAGRNSPGQANKAPVLEKPRETYTYSDSSELRRSTSQASGRALYDPNAAAAPSRPTSTLQRRDSNDSDNSNGGVPIRQPRGPDGTRGFNFGGRGRRDE